MLIGATATSKLCSLIYKLHRADIIKTTTLCCLLSACGGGAGDSSGSSFINTNGNNSVANSSTPSLTSSPMSSLTSASSISVTTGEQAGSVASARSSTSSNQRSTVSASSIASSSTVSSGSSSLSTAKSSSSSLGSSRSSFKSSSSLTSSSVSSTIASSVASSFSSTSSISSKSNSSSSQNLSSSISAASSSSVSSSANSSASNSNFKVRVQGLRLGGQLTLTHGTNNTLVTLNEPMSIATTLPVGVALDLRITAQPEGQTCALSELAPTTIPAADTPIFVRCVHNEVAHLTMPETLPNDPLQVNFALRDVAYPGIPYESRPGVVGGIFPYEYRLKGLTLNGVAQSTAGVSLDFRRGTLHFTPTNEGTYVVSIQIKDSGTAQKTLNQSFTIQSAASRFVFVAPIGTDNTGRGAIATPYRTLGYALSQSAPNQVVLLRKGTHPAGKSDLGDSHSKQILAYPDEVAVVDFAKTNSFWIKNGDAAAPAARIEDLDIANVAQYGVTCEPCKAGLSIRNIRFVSGYETWSASENPSFIHGRDTGLRQNKMLIQDNDFGKYTMTYTANNYAAMVLFSAGDSIAENNQMRQNQTSSIAKGLVDKAWSNNNTHRENYIELAANQPEHDGIFLMAQSGSDRVHVHHNLLINAGMIVGGQCFQTTCHMIDHNIHHNTLVNGGVSLTWGPLNPPSSGTRVFYNIIKAGTSTPYGGWSCQARPSTIDITTKVNIGDNMIESSNPLAFKDSECSGNNIPWAEWRGTYGMDTAASGSTLSTTSSLVGTGVLTGLPLGDTRRTQRGHQY